MGPEPQRTCIGCRTRHPQRKLIRLFVNDAGAVEQSRSGPGRGAWLCANTAVTCLDAAIEARSLARAFRRRLDPGATGALRDRLTAAAEAPRSAEA